MQVLPPMLAAIAHEKAQRMKETADAVRPATAKVSATAT